MMDLDGLKQDIQAAAERNTERVEVPDGQYECKVEKMEMKESKTGNPMISIWFRILAGDFKNSVLFINQTIHTGFGLHTAKKTLSDMDTGLPVDFQSFAQFAGLIESVKEAIETQKLEYAVKYTTTKNDFKNFEITEVFRPN
jgi:hypothetical protein